MVPLRIESRVYDIKIGCSCQDTDRAANCKFMIKPMLAFKLGETRMQIVLQVARLRTTHAIFVRCVILFDGVWFH